VTARVAGKAPAALRDLKQWVIWRKFRRSGRPTKLPYCAAEPHRCASSTDPATWATFDEALAAWDGDPSGGVGFVFTGTPFAGIDLDHVRDPDTGVVIAEARAVVDTFATYSEASQSGTGIHILFAGEMPGKGRKGTGGPGWQIEAYSSGRYFCVTGERLGDITDVRECQPALDALLASPYFTKPGNGKPRAEATLAGPAKALELDDAALIEKMLRSNHSFGSLWAGDWSAYDSQSEADAALLTHAAWMTAGDPERMDRLFRQSGLYRQKWERADYRELSLSFAIEKNSGACYSGTGTRPAQVRQPGQPRPSEPTIAPAKAKPAGSFHLTELGNAERLAARHHGSVYAVRGIDELRGYDPARGIYSADHGLLVRYASDTVRSMYAEAGDALTDEAKDLRKHAARSEAKRTLDAMLDLSKSLESLEAEPEDFDANPEMLNTLSGVVDLASGDMRPHAAKYRMTKIAGCGYAPGAATPKWDAFLARIFDGDAELIAFLQRLFGYALSGYIGEQIFAIFHGAGANGKSVLVDTWHAAMGDYAGTAAMKTFLPHSTEAVRTDLASFCGRRLVSTSESKPAQVIDAATIKVMTSKHVTARFLYQRSEFTYSPQYLVILDTNYKPLVQCDDYAIKRRVLLVPFNVLIPDEEQDKKLTDTLIAEELPGILAWGVAGAVDYLKNGLRIPEAVRAATDEYRDEMDALHEFWRQWLTFGEPDVYSTAKAIRDALEVWAGENGVDPKDLPKGSEWGRQLHERGARRDKKKINGKNTAVWFGVRIVGEEAQEAMI